MADMNVRQLFEASLVLSEPERARFLAKHCRRDPDRRAHVERLLRAHSEAADFLALPTVDQPEVPAGRQVGPFELIGRIGEGGFATVYLAHQQAPIARDVALKILKEPVDSAQWLARFEAERRVLALMDHPGIARVLDAGATTDGRPYCAMELVRGPSITDYCDAAQLDLRRRLDLFIGVCRAVQHAHQRGVIHRDLKPDNILIALQDGRPIPKVIDFGIAKAVRGAGAASALPGLTERWQLVGTPQYMSPEQAEGAADIDTRTDIYSLGAVLYELLTGTTPFPPARLRAATWTELVRILREEDPPRPSVRMLAELRVDQPQSQGRDLLHALRSDLDWVVLKCLAREPSHRYETVADLAADLGRFLDGQPVVAAPPSASYRARKFMRRHRRQVAVAAVLVASLLGGTVGAMLFAWRSLQREEETAQVAAIFSEMLGRLDAEQIGAGLQQDLRKQAERLRGLPTAVGVNPGPDPEPQPTPCYTSAAVHSLYVSVFEPTLRDIESKLAEHPERKAWLIGSIGDSLTRLGLFEQAAASHTRVLELLRPRRDEDDLDVLAAHHKLGSALASEIMANEAQLHAELAYRGRLRKLGPDDPRTLFSAELLGHVHWRLHRIDVAEALLADTLKRRQDKFGGERKDTIRSLWRMAQVRLSQGRMYDAETLLARARASPGLARVNESLRLAIDGTLGNLRHRLGWSAEGERILEGTLARSRQFQADDHRDTMFLRCLLLDVSLKRKEPGAIEKGVALAAQRHSVFGEVHPDSVSSDFTLALAYWQNDDLDAAEAGLRNVLERARSCLGLGVACPVTQEITQQFALLLDKRANTACARDLRWRCVLEALNANPEATTYYDPAFSTAFFDMLLAVDDQGELRRRFEDCVRQRYSEKPRIRCCALTRFANALLRANCGPDAEALALQAIACAPGDAAGSLDLMDALDTRARALTGMGRLDEALDVHEKVRGLHTAWAARTGERLPNYEIGHARCLAALGRYRDAEAILVSSMDAFSTDAEGAHRPPIALVDALVDLYAAWPGEAKNAEHSEKAAHWREVSARAK